MIVTSARLSGNQLILTLTNPSEAAKTVHKFNAGEYELTKVKKKRSLDANAYCWTLIHKIAEKVHEPPVDVYRAYIRDIGCKSHVVCIQADDVETEVETFLQGHIGRMVQIGESKIPGCATIIKKYGSSSFSVQQMQAFIEAIIQDCIALDIEYKTPEEIDSLLAQWGAYDG